MKTSEKLPDFNNLQDLGIRNVASVHWNLTPEELTKITLSKNMGVLASSRTIFLVFL